MNTLLRPRAYAMIGLVISFIIVAILTMVSINQMAGPDTGLPNPSATTTSPAPGYTTTTPPTNITSGAQGGANATTALAIADKVFYSDQSGYPPLPTSVTQYSLAAAGFSNVTGVVTITGGAQFNFTTGPPVCVSAGELDATPAVVACG